MIANLVSGTFRVTTEFYKMVEVTGIFVLSSLAIFDGKKKTISHMSEAISRLPPIPHKGCMSFFITATKTLRTFT